MLHTASCHFGSFAIMIAVSLAGPAPAVSDEDLRSVGHGNNALACELYQQLGEAEGNLAFSPASISTALAMTYGGARGQTATQMAEVLHFDLPNDRLHAAFGRLAGRWNQTGSDAPTRIRLANRLWPAQTEKLLDAYCDLTRTHYGAEMQPLDYAGATEDARQTINQWVEQHTERKIQDLLLPGDIDPGTVLVLTNAVYFQGTWQYRFDEQHTASGPFQVSKDRQVEVPLMSQRGKFPLGQTEQAQILELPFAGADAETDLAMTILLPRAADGLERLEEQLSAEALDRWVAAMSPQFVQISLPRFKLTARYRLEKVLQAMGMTLAFGRGADFSGLTSSGGTFIDRVVHKTWVDVNEQGAEAAAATGVVKKRSAPTQFRADHPFVFVIRDRVSGAILFIGRVADPTA